MHSVHNDHEKELEIISGPPEPNYQDTVLTTHRKELKNHSNTTEVELPKTTSNIQDLSLIKYSKISIDQSADLRLTTGS